MRISEIASDFASRAATAVTRGAMNVAERTPFIDMPWERVTRGMPRYDSSTVSPAVMFGGILEKRWMAEPVRRALDTLGVPMDIAETGPLNLDSFAASVPRLAKQVDATSAQHVARGGDGRVSLVGHSKGGIVALKYAQSLGDIDLARVRQIITLGSPLHGVELLTPPVTGAVGKAPLPLPPALRDLLSSSDEGPSLMRELPAFMERWRRLVPDARIVSVSTNLGLGATDGIVRHGWSRLPDSIAGVHNLMTYGGNHASVGGTVVGMHDASFRALAYLLAGEDVRTAARAVGGIAG